LDISGIDNDRTFEIPLSEIYVKLRVMFDPDANGQPDSAETSEGAAIDIETALARYRKLVIVGDPGSGKSTFLKFVALILARSFLTKSSALALEKLSFVEPLPIPIFVSCWDLSDFLKQKGHARASTLVEFIADRLTTYDFQVGTADVEAILESGSCCILLDGLDEVPSDAARATVSRLTEDFVHRYSENRFVVSSRIRAYTGDTILKGGFARCDIQPFDLEDRLHFVRNWVALLFRIRPEDVNSPTSDAEREFTSLLEGVEKNDRIRTLAVNPLLLTVVAIVHWNRKRLPEQRVDLYDECVDVLLGQRREAEHIQHSRKFGIFDERSEDEIHERRAWVRKRFAEIALHILCRDADHDEASKAEMIKLLAPRFIDQGAKSEDDAAARAELFLQRQELTSGLLVSRRTLSYRFVHLTFQEFLAAWQLSNLEFDDVTKIIEPRLRLAKWFETLQLLGGQWAKESDEKANRYVKWLLQQRGQSIAQRAPVVALCANIVRDIAGVAELRPDTRKVFEAALKSTLDVFNQGSRVPATTQLEILAALGQLGGAVKPQLIDATKASLYQVRRDAIDLLLPHLSNDELFSMVHILEDRSATPIGTYLSALIRRDSSRMAGWLTDDLCCGSKFEAGSGMTWESLFGGIEAWRAPSSGVARDLFETIIRFSKFEFEIRAACVRALSERWPDERTRIFLTDLLSPKADLWKLHAAALQALVQTWPNDSHRLLLENIMADGDAASRSDALQLLAAHWPDGKARDLIVHHAQYDEDPIVRGAAILTIAKIRPDGASRALVVERLLHDTHSGVRHSALQAIVSTWPDEETRDAVSQAVVADPSDEVRDIAWQYLSEKWLDEKTRNLMRLRAHIDGHAASLLSGTSRSFGRLLFSRDLDGLPPYLNPREPIPVRHIGKAAMRIGLVGTRLTTELRKVNERLGWDVQRGSSANKADRDRKG